MTGFVSVTLLGLGDHVCRRTWPLIRHSFRVFWNIFFSKFVNFLLWKVLIN